MEAQKAICGTISGSRRSVSGIVAGGLSVVHHTRPWRNVAEPRTPERFSAQRAHFPSLDAFCGGLIESCVCGYSSRKHVTRHKKTCAVACAHAESPAGSVGSAGRASKNNIKRDAQTQTEPAPAPSPAPAPACKGGCHAPTLIGIADGAADGAVLCPLEDGLSFFCKDDLKRHLCEAHPAFLDFMKELVFPQEETLAEDMGL